MNGGIHEDRAPAKPSLLRWPRPLPSDRAIPVIWQNLESNLESSIAERSAFFSNRSDLNAKIRFKVLVLDAIEINAALEKDHSVIF